MRRFQLSPKAQEVLAVSVPILALLISLMGVYPSWGRYTEQRREVQKQRQELAKLKAAPLPPRDPVLPAAEDLPSESAQFLGQIAALTIVPQCRLVGLDTAAMAPPVSNGRIKAVRTKVEVEGRYPQIRRFLAQLASAPRLFVVAGLDISLQHRSRSQPGEAGALRAVVDVERYVEVSRPLSTPTAAPGQVPGGDSAAGGVALSSSR